MQKKTPTLRPSPRHGDAGGADKNPGAHDSDGHFKHGSLYAENSPQQLCAPGGPLSDLLEKPAQVVDL